MNNLNSVISNGIKNIWERDSKSQENFLEAIAQVRDTSIDLLKQINAFFVPNDEYLAKYCGDIIRDYEYDCYNEFGECRWSNWLVIPIYDVSNTIVGLGGFNPFLYTQAHQFHEKLNYYQYSSSRLFKKGKYVYTPQGVYEKALRDGYLFIVDGLFDCASLCANGFNAAALMGSNVTPEIVVLLRFIKRVIVIADNDDAGLKLYETLKIRLPYVEMFKQGLTKDIDELLKSENGLRAKRILEKIVTSSPQIMVKADFGRPKCK